MLVTFKTDKKQLRFNDKIKCTVVIDEIDWSDFHECSLMMIMSLDMVVMIFMCIGSTDQQAQGMPQLLDRARNRIHSDQSNQVMELMMIVFIMKLLRYQRQTQKRGL